MEGVENSRKLPYMEQRKAGASSVSALMGPIHEPTAISPNINKRIYLGEWREHGQVQWPLLLVPVRSGPMLDSKLMHFRQVVIVIITKLLFVEAT